MTSGLYLEHVRAGYGDSVVLDALSLTLQPGSSLAVLGRNGMGKSTLLATLAGITTLHSGRITLNNHDLGSTPSHQRARLGLAWVPQERAIFSTLTVEENLTVAARPGNWSLTRVYDYFPRLSERRHNMGAQLSGGEQQMLAIGRALMLNPRVLLLDEPLEGLAPRIAQALLNTLAQLEQDSSMSILIVEQHPHQVLPITQNAIILERGRIVYQASSPELLSDLDSLERYLGVTSDRRVCTL